MTLQELRIGNEVIDLDGNLRKVHGLVKTPNESCIVHSVGGQFTYIEEIVGIPLTVEHFINHDFAYEEFEAGVGYWMKNQFTAFEGDDGSFSFDSLGRMEYLHELQNCYFAFVGQEL